MTNSDPPAIAHRLASGAVLSVARLVLVVAAGLIGTVYLARALGPSAWGIYAAIWSTALLAGAAITHGPRDRITAAGNRDQAVSFSLLASTVSFPFAGLVYALSFAMGSSGIDGTLELGLAVGVWLVGYPLRLPAMVDALIVVRPVRVMVLESLDAVIVPSIAALILVGGAFGGVMPLAIGVAVSTVLGLCLGWSWSPRHGQRIRLRLASTAIRESRALAAYHLVANGRELAVPGALALAMGSASAGAYGLGIAMGAMVALALAAAAQPAYGALSAIGNDLVRAARLTNVSRRVLASILAVAIPALWAGGPSVIELLFGPSWVSASTTILLVITTSAVNASIVPWVNVLVHSAAANRGLLLSQGAAAAAVLASAVSTRSVVLVATVFLISQIFFGLYAARRAATVLPAVTSRDQLLFATVALAGSIAAVAATGPMRLVGPLFAALAMVLLPLHSTRESWRLVLASFRHRA